VQEVGIELAATKKAHGVNLFRLMGARMVCAVPRIRRNLISKRSDRRSNVAREASGVRPMTRFGPCPPRPPTRHSGGCAARRR